jgi:carboxyl-terminal processing protease
MVRTSRAIWWGALASLLVGFLSFASGMAVALQWGNTLPLANILGPARGAQRATPGDLQQNFKVYWETWNLVERSFYRTEPLDHQEMVYASIEGMLRSLEDDYTFFQRPEAAEQTRASMSGKFEGIGAYIEARDGKILIVAPIEGSPAERAGLLPGDVVLKVDTAEMAPLVADLEAGDATQKAVSLIRGPKGSTVTILVYRPSTEREIEFVITRDTIPEITVRGTLLDGDIAWVQLTGFKGTTTSELDKVLNKLLAEEPRGIVLDLRNNGGGLLTTAQEVLGRFLDGGLALYEEYGSGKVEEKPVLRASGDPRAFDIPMVVLINNGSASASEIVAGALRDRGRAVLIGEKSFGKGSVQSVEHLSDDSSARITVAHWFTPRRTEIHKVGLTPEHVVLPATDEQYTLELPQRWPNDPPSVSDAQLWWAVRMLATEETPPPPPTVTAAPSE